MRTIGAWSFMLGKALGIARRFGELYGGTFFSLSLVYICLLIFFPIVSSVQESPLCSGLWKAVR